jgi:transglutaminase-like putative cysteine protease
MRLDVRYRTLFTYDAKVRESHDEVRACPVTDDRQQLIAYRMTVSPSARTLAFTDYWGTRVDAFGVRAPHDSLEIVAEAAVETGRRRPIAVTPAIDELRDPQFLDLHAEYLHATRHTDWDTPVQREAARLLDRNGPDVVRTVLALNGLVGARLEYVPGSTHIGIPVEEVLLGGKGVCQDYAHLAVALCRSIGVPARYVSGYLFTRDDSTGEDVEDGAVARVQTHAWFEAAIPGVGWFPLDPTNRMEVSTRHVKIGHGRDYDDVPPLRGLYAGSASPTVTASVEIRRMDVTRQPTATVQPPTPRPVESRRRVELAQQQQQQQQQQ